MINSTLAAYERQLARAKALFHLNEWVRSQSFSRPTDAQFEVTVSDRNDYSRYFDYSGALTRVYSDYENFVFECTRVWLRILAETNYACLKVDELKDMRNHYRALIGYCLQFLSPKRLETIGTQRLMLSALKIQRERIKEPFIPEVFQANLNNLRLTDLLQLLASVKLIDASGFIESRAYLRSFMEDAGTTLDSYLRDLVQRRNEVAHGTTAGDLLGVTALVDIADFLGLLGRALHDLLLQNILRLSSGCVEVGTIFSSYKQKKVVVVKSNTELISVSDWLIVRNESQVICTSVARIELEGSSLASVNPGQNELVGLELLHECPKNGRIFRILQPLRDFL